MLFRGKAKRKLFLRFVLVDNLPGGALIDKIAEKLTAIIGTSLASQRFQFFECIALKFEA